MYIFNKNYSYTTEDIDSHENIKKPLSYLKDKIIYLSKNDSISTNTILNLLNSLNIYSNDFNIILYGGKAKKVVNWHENGSKNKKQSKNTSEDSKELENIFKDNQEDSDFIVFNILQEHINKTIIIVEQFFKTKYPVKVKTVSTENYLNFKITPKDDNFINNRIDITIKPDDTFSYLLSHRSFCDSIMFNCSSDQIIFPEIFLENREKCLTFTEFLELRKNELSSGCSLDKYIIEQKSSSYFVRLYTEGHIDPVEFIERVLNDLDIYKFKKYISHIPLSSQPYVYLHWFILHYGSELSTEKLEQSWVEINELIKKKFIYKTFNDSPLSEQIEKLENSLDSFNVFHTYLLSLIFTSDTPLIFDQPIQIALDISEKKITMSQPKKKSSSNAFYFLLMPKSITKYLIMNSDSIINTKGLNKHQVTAWLSFYSKLLLDDLFNDKNLIIEKKRPLFITKDQLYFALLTHLCTLQDDLIYKGLLSILDQIDTDFTSLNDEQKKRLSAIGEICLPLFLLHNKSLSKDSSSEGLLNLLFLILSFISKDKKILFSIDNTEQQKTICNTLLTFISLMEPSKKTDSEEFIHHLNERLDALIELYMDNSPTHKGLTKLLRAVKFTIEKKLSLIFQQLENEAASELNIPFLKEVKEPLINKGTKDHWRSWLNLWNKTLSFCKNGSKEFKTLITLFEDIFKALYLNSNSNLNLLVPYYFEKTQDSLSMQLNLLSSEIVKPDLKIDNILMKIGENPTSKEWPTIKKTGEFFVKSLSEKLEKPEKYTLDFSLGFKNESINAVEKLCLIWVKIIKSLKLDNKGVKGDQKNAIELNKNILLESEELFDQIISIFYDASSIENSPLLFSWIVETKTPIFTNKKIFKETQKDECVKKICTLFLKYLPEQKSNTESTLLYKKFFQRLDQNSTSTFFSLILQVQIMLLRQWIENSFFKKEDLDDLLKQITDIHITHNKEDHYKLSDVLKLQFELIEKIFKCDSLQTISDLCMRLQTEILISEELKIKFHTGLQKHILNLPSTHHDDLNIIKQLCNKLNFEFIDQETVILFAKAIKNQLFKCKPLLKSAPHLFAIFNLLSPFYSITELEEMGLFLGKIKAELATEWILRNKLSNLSKFEKFLEKIKYSKELENHLLETILNQSEISSFDLELFSKIVFKTLSSTHTPSSETWLKIILQLNSITDKTNSNLKYSVTPSLKSLLIIIDNSINPPKECSLIPEEAFPIILISVDRLHSLFDCAICINICEKILNYLIEKQSTLFYELTKKISYKSLYSVIIPLISHTTSTNNYNELASKLILKEKNNEFFIICHLYLKELCLYENTNNLKEIIDNTPDENKKKLESISSIFNLLKAIPHEYEEKDRKNLIKESLKLIDTLDSQVDSNTQELIVLPLFEILLEMVIESTSINEYNHLYAFCIAKYQENNLKYQQKYKSIIPKSKLFESDKSALFEIFVKGLNSIKNPLQYINLLNQTSILMITLALKSRSTHFSSYQYLVKLMDHFNQSDSKNLHLNPRVKELLPDITLRILSDFQNFISDSRFTIETFHSIYFIINEKMITDKYYIPFFNFIIFIFSKPNKNILLENGAELSTYATSLNLIYQEIRLIISDLKEFNSFFKGFLNVLKNSNLSENAFAFLYSALSSIILNKKNKEDFIELGLVLVSNITEKNFQKKLSYKLLGTLISFTEKIEEKLKKLSQKSENYSEYHKEYTNHLKNLSKVLENCIIVPPVNIVFNSITWLFNTEQLKTRDYLECCKNLCQGLTKILDPENTLTAYEQIINILEKTSSILSEKEDKEFYIDFVLNLLPLIFLRTSSSLKKTFFGDWQRGKQANYDFAVDYNTPITKTILYTLPVQKINLPCFNKFKDYFFIEKKTIGIFITKKFIPCFENNNTNNLDRKKFLAKINLLIEVFMENHNTNDIKLSEFNSSPFESNLFFVNGAKQIIFGHFPNSTNAIVLSQLDLNRLALDWSSDEIVKMFLSDLEESHFDHLKKAEEQISNLNFSDLTKNERTVILTQLQELIQSSFLLDFEFICVVTQIYQQIKIFLEKNNDNFNDLNDPNDLNQLLIAKIAKDITSYIDRAKESYENLSHKVFSIILEKLNDSEDIIEWYSSLISGLLDLPDNFKFTQLKLNLNPLIESILYTLDFISSKKRSGKDKIQFLETTLQSLYHKQYEFDTSIDPPVHWLFGIYFISAYMNHCLSCNNVQTRDIPYSKEYLSTILRTTFSFKLYSDNNNHLSSCIIFLIKMIRNKDHILLKDDIEIHQKTQNIESLSQFFKDSDNSFFENTFFACNVFDFVKDSLSESLDKYTTKTKEELSKFTNFK